MVWVAEEQDCLDCDFCWLWNGVVGVFEPVYVNSGYPDVICHVLLRHSERVTGRA